jgi:acetyl-CoA synthetase
MSEEKKGISSVMQETRKFPPAKSVTDKAHIKTWDQYQKMWTESVNEPEKFWGKIGEEFEWYKKWDKVVETEFNTPKIEWYKGGKLNLTVNALDRHVKGKRANQVALIWQGEPEDDVKKYTYKQLLEEVCKFANVLKKKGVKTGFRSTCR